MHPQWAPGGAELVWEEHNACVQAELACSCPQSPASACFSPLCLGHSCITCLRSCITYLHYLPLCLLLPTPSTCGVSAQAVSSLGAGPQ